MYPKQKKLKHPVHGVIIFDLLSQEEYIKLTVVGNWRDPKPDDEDKNLKKSEQDKANVAEQKAEETPETITTDSAETVTKDEVIVEDFTCDICGKLCKSALSLRMHKLHKHKVK